MATSNLASLMRLKSLGDQGLDTIPNATPGDNSGFNDLLDRFSDASQFKDLVSKSNDNDGTKVPWSQKALDALGDKSVPDVDTKGTGPNTEGVTDIKPKAKTDETSDDVLDSTDSLGVHIPDYMTGSSTSSDQPKEPGSPDMNSIYDQLLKRASVEGPAIKAYREALQSAPERSDYKPSFYRRLTAAFAGLGYGPEGARNVLNYPYSQAESDYQQKLKNLTTEGGLEGHDIDRLGHVASIISSKTYHDMMMQSRKDREAEFERENQARDQARTDEAARRTERDKELKLEAGLRGKEINARIGEIGARQKELEEATKGRQDRNKALGQQDINDNILTEARERNWPEPTDPKTGAPKITKDSPNQAALFLAHDLTRDKFPEHFPSDDELRAMSPGDQLEKKYIPKDPSKADALRSWTHKAYQGLKKGEDPSTFSWGLNDIQLP